jgi:hypothetical protein
LQLFKDGLTERQIELILELFKGNRHAGIAGRDRQGRVAWLFGVIVQFKMGPKNVLVWNVWGLHAGRHRNALHDLVMAEWVSLVCIQETKLDVIFDFDVIQLLGAGFEYVYLPAVLRFGQATTCRRRPSLVAYVSLWLDAGRRQGCLPCRVA